MPRQGLEKTARRGAAAALVSAAACLLTPLSCTRDYESPYVPGSNSYAGDDWTKDADGDGVADMVAQFAPDCDRTPKECLEIAKTVSKIGTNYGLGAVDMILWKGAEKSAPRLTWQPAGASALGVVLSSSDTAKVRIRDGMLEAVGVGSAQVTATVPVDSRSVSFIVKVVAEGERVTGVSARDTSVRAGEEIWPAIEWTPADARYPEYTLSIDSPHVATVAGGRVKAIFPGTAKVVVEAMDGGHRGAFTLTVIDAPLRVEAVSVLVEDMYLVAGAGEEAPVVHYTPASVTRKAWLLAPVNPDVADVSREGDRIVPLKPGKTDVTFYSLDGSGLRAAFSVNVYAQAVPVTGIAAADLKLTRGGDPTPPRITWIPAEATNRRYVLTTDSAPVADVAGNLVLPRDTGATTMKVVAADGGHSATFRVEVALPDTAIHVDSVRGFDMTMTAGSIRRPSLAWYPANAYDRGYDLSSSNPAVAKAVGDSIHALSQGTAEMTVVADDGGHRASFRVTVVRIPVQRVVADDLSLVAGTEAGPSLSWFPGDASDLSFTLRSLDPSVAIILSDSVTIKAVSVGNTRIIVRSKDGPSDTLALSVLARPVPVTRMEVDDVTVGIGDPADKDVSGGIRWEPSNATNKSFRLLSSSNAEAVVIVDNRLRGLAVGTSRVIVESLDEARLRDTITVTSRVFVKSFAVRDTAVWQGGADVNPAGLIAWTPAEATNKGVAMQSLDTGVIKVLQDGKLRIGNPGAANVVVRSNENPAKADTFRVTVKIHVRTLTVLRDTTVWVGMTKVSPWPLLAWTPSNATEKWWWLDWVGTPNPAVAQMSDSWNFDAKGPGQVKFAVIYAWNSQVRDTLTVTVRQAVQSVSVPNYAMKVGDPDLAPAVSVLPSDASDKGYTLSGGQAGVATLAAGKVRAEGPGTATFTARSNEGGKTTTFTVTVTQPVTGITAANITLRLGEPDQTLPVTVQPSNASNKTYTVNFSSPVVSVVNNRLHPVSAGSATATVTTVDGGKTATFEVTVVQPVTGIAAGNMTLVKNTEGSPSLVWTPQDATNKGFTMTSGNTSVAYISGTKVRAVGGGTATITVTTADGGKTATFTATVVVPVESISAGNMEMRVGDADANPNIIWTPGDVTNRNFTLSSSNNNVATIVNGRIHAVSRGTCTITVTSVDGGKTDTFLLEVQRNLSD